MATPSPALRQTSTDMVPRASLNLVDSTGLFDGSPAAEAAIWMGRLCTLDAKRGEITRSFGAQWRSVPLVGRIAGMLDQTPALVDEVATEALFWKEKASLLNEAAPALSAANPCALRMMVGKTIVAINRLTSIEGLGFKTIRKLQEAAATLRQILRLDPSYEQIVPWFQPTLDLFKEDATIANLLLESTTQGIKLSSTATSGALKPNENIPRSLTELRILLSRKEVIERLYNGEVIALYTLFNRLSLNYIVHQRCKIHFFPQIIDACEAIRSSLYNELKSRHEHDSEAFTVFWSRLPVTIHDQLQSLRIEAESIPGYPSNFLTTPLHSEILSQIISDNLEIYRQLFAVSSVAIEGLQFIDGDDSLGIRIYKLNEREPSPTQKGSKARLVVSIKATELLSLITHYKPLQSKDPVFNVMGHSPVFQTAKTLYQRFKEIILSKTREAGMEELERLPITTLGFGLNGAAAQLLAFQWTKEHAISFEHPKDGNLCVGLGVPEYLEIESALSVGTQTGLYSLNLANRADDVCLKASALSSMVGASYGGSNFNTYPLFDKITGVAFNITGHQLEDYAYNFVHAMKIAQSFYAHMAQVQSMEERFRPYSLPIALRLTSVSDYARARAAGAPLSYREEAAHAAASSASTILGDREEVIQAGASSASALPTQEVAHSNDS